MIRQATRQKAKIRLGLSAVSGGGKTYSALLVAYGLCGDWSKIVVIDTENGSADLYSHLGAYNVWPLVAPFAPEAYIKAIKGCEKAGMEVIVIDSISHEWEGQGGVLDLCDTIGGGFSSAWKQMTPRHEKYKQAILQSTSHIITTVRRKQEYALQEGTNSQGRTVQKPVKLGMKEQTREGWEYEVTVNLELDQEHRATSSKDRTGLFAGKDPFIITEETGLLIRQWCESGVAPLAVASDPVIPESKPILAMDHPAWEDIKTAINNGERTIDQLKAKFDLSPEVENYFKPTVPVTQQDLKEGKPF